jgi:bacteriocin-like protein
MKEAYSDPGHSADERAFMSLRPSLHEGKWPSFKSRREIMNELTLNELDQVSGGKYTFDIEQTLNIGSQSNGAGAGKVTFNPFSITRKVDRASPVFFALS